MLCRLPAALFIMTVVMFFLPGFAFTQQTGQQPALELDLEKFPQQTKAQTATEDLQLNLDQFDQKQKELELNLEQFEQSENPQGEGSKLNLEQFDNNEKSDAQVGVTVNSEGSGDVSLPGSKQVAGTTADQSRNNRGAGIEISGFTVFVIVSVLFLLIFLWRKRGKRRRA